MPPFIKILIVEDHEALREVMMEYLAEQGYYIVGASNADDMDDALSTDNFDLLVLDLQLPGEDGLSIANRLKKSKPDLYIIMMTAKVSEADKVTGYMSGADVYLPKPTTPELLAAAIASVSRRIGSERQHSIDFDFVQMLLKGEQETLLTKQEAIILKALLEAPSQMLSHTRLMDMTDKYLSSRGKSNLEVQLTRLRKKLVDAGVASPAIKVVRNQGYQLLSNQIILR
jgi:two-component system phosphate regulon response regulator OmpR